MEGQEKSILLKEKQAKILIALADKSQRWYITSLAKSANATYVHTSKFVALCQTMGLVDAEVHGKIKTLTLTEKGQGIAESLISISNKLNSGTEQKPQNPKSEQKSEK